MTTTTCAQCAEFEIRLEERQRMIDCLMDRLSIRPEPVSFAPVIITSQPSPCCTERSTSPGSHSHSVWGGRSDSHGISSGSIGQTTHNIS